MAIVQIPLVRARLLGFVVECIFYGLFTAFFGGALYFLLTQKRALTTWLLVTLLVMYLVATLHVSVILSAGFEAFASDPTVPAIKFYANVSNWHEAAQGVLLETQMIIGDIFMIYRCLVVWDRKWYIIILPVLSLLGTAVGGYGGAAALLRTTPGDALSVSHVKPYLTVAAVTTAFTNIVCTACIGLKLFTVQRRLRGVSSSAGVSASYRALIIIVESAAIWTCAMLTFLVLYLSGSNGQYVILDLASSLIGINFSAIIIRISIGSSSFGGLPVSSSGDGYRGAYNSGGGTGSGSRQIATIGGTRRFAGGPEEVELSVNHPSSRHAPVSVHVDKFIEVDHERSEQGDKAYYSP